MTLNDLTVDLQAVHYRRPEARTVIRLPSSFASAWSPGFDLHVTGTGDSMDDALGDLRDNLRTLGRMLIDRASEL